MLKKFNYREITWIDLEKPSKKELAEIEKDYKANRQFLSLTATLPHQATINFIAGIDFIITIHDETIKTLTDFAKIFGHKLNFEKTGRERSTGTILLSILQAMYDLCEQELEKFALKDQLKRAKQCLETNQEISGITTVNQLNEYLYNFRLVLRPLKDTLNSLEPMLNNFFKPENFNSQFKTLIMTHDKICQTMNLCHQATVEFYQIAQTTLLAKKVRLVRLAVMILIVFVLLSLIIQFLL